MSNNNTRINTYYIYEITNNLDGRTYIGQHRCPFNKTPENDGYMGSGIHLNNSQKKYGIENFSKKDISNLS